MIVLDASAVIEWLLNTNAGMRVEHRVAAKGGLCHAPALLDLEVANALRRLERDKAIDRLRAEEVIDDLLNLPLIRHAPDPFLRRIWSLHDNFTPYAAAYLVLAEALGCPVLTFDKKFLPAARHGMTVELL